MDIRLAKKHSGNDTLFSSFQDGIPGPGFYDVIHQSPVFNNVSLSKKGTCTFPSMVRTPSLSKATSGSVISFVRCINMHWTSGPFSPKAMVLIRRITTASGVMQVN